VIPYFGYARQDRKDQPRVPISAKLVGNLIERAGANRVLTIDLHSEQIQGFFDIPVDNIFPTPVFRRYITQLSGETHIVVSPDVGGVKRARAIAKKLGNLPLALIDKRRPAPNVAEVVHIIGDVRNKRVVLVDDIIDTGNTLAKAAMALKDKGAIDICAIATHGVFSKGAKDIIDNSPIEKVWVTNTLPKRDSWPEKTVSLSIGELLADVILRIHEERSVSQVFI
jgi:ribose-phosphate pyrophosphokinase